MKKIKVQIVNAFVDYNSGGNPAGIVLNADNLSNIEKLEITSKVGLSETAFVSKSTVADFKLDFFTPIRQIAHCGHATIATFSYLKQLNLLKTKISSKETIDGLRRIQIEGEFAFMEQLSPKFVNVSHKQDLILESIGLKVTDLLPNAPIQLVNTGNSFIIIPVKNTEILKKATPNYDLITEISTELDLIGYYIFTQDLNDPERDATTRMFAPRYGILEEAGTGMAAGTLAGYLYNTLKIKKNRFFIQQGKFMQPPSTSLIIVDLTIEKEKIKSIMAGGKGMLIEAKEIEY
ncbi:PhzF family phenazine biosynthesis protein [Sabulilitoribacter multivorans]|uniref:PhzF family phenazine biosynthesis protein n=1 Tax=Flaviramulus multivorans TaxID=1304750 RepID=A0ABS9IFR5_9FLAO|nr:PhzF family phenazine biosynthesis protein [Flaviramulus multivorans]MCF7559012.1 PhzF family phenazine biosynthesis protein [Flaviramulus multivorans]